MFGKGLIAASVGLGLLAPAMSSASVSCEEEQLQAQAWIQWAAERRTTCLLNTVNQETRAGCLQEVRRELANLEREHTRVYSDQIRTLHPRHPVVKNLLAKLQANVGAAEIAINTDTEPEQIAALRKQVCLNRH
jgi:F0F1-type ATP synthase delta subunit